MKNEKIYCKTHQCSISISGCIARQKRAQKADGAWQGTMMMNCLRGMKNRAIPFDPLCKDCEQGRQFCKVLK